MPRVDREMCDTQFCCYDCPALEVYAESELHYPWIPGERRDLRRGPGADIAARCGKQRVIENVKDLPTEFGPQVFRDREVLDQSSVEDVGSGRVKRIAAAIPHDSIA